MQEELVGEYGHWEFDVATVEEVIGHLVAAPCPNFANWSRGYQRTEVIWRVNYRAGDDALLYNIRSDIHMKLSLILYDMILLYIYHIIQ